MFKPDKSKVNHPLNRHLNQLMSRKSLYYLVAKAIWDYAKSLDGTIQFSTADIMHDEDYKSHFKTLCSNRSFDVEVKIVNAGGAWIDKSDPKTILQDL